MVAVSDKLISSCIDKLLCEFCRYGKPTMTVVFKGETIELTMRYLKALRERENAHLSKSAKGTRKSKEVTTEKRSEIVEKVFEKVGHALTRSAGLKVSPLLRKFVLSNVQVSLNARKEAPKPTTFIPRLLFFIDDHFISFLKKIKLSLLAKNMEDSPGNAQLVKDITLMETSMVDYLAKNQVGASPVFNALLTFYTNTHGLRVKDTTAHNSMIKMDTHLQEFINSPMDSMFRGKSLASNYIGSASKKTDETDVKLPSFRKANPGKSVMDYFMSSCTTDEENAKKAKDDKALEDAKKVKAALRDGYIMGKHIMSIVSAHLIPVSSFLTPDSEALSMDMDTDGVHKNVNVNTLIVLQAVISASNKVDARYPSVAHARSPTRSSSRSPKRSSSVAPSRSPSRSPRK